MRLQQQMRLSPRLIQAMEILQLPLLALQERIEEELSSNPCLELKDADGETPPEAEGQDERSRGDEPMVMETDQSRQADFQRLDDFGEAHAEDLEWSERSPRSWGTGERDPKMDALANAPAPEQGLTDHLLGQWAFVEAPEAVKAPGLVIITNIDEDGYLRTPLEELAGGNPPVPLAGLKAALPLVQKLDPPGVGARDLRECLLIQLDAEADAGRDVALPRLLVSEFLREIELNHIPQIAKRTGRPVSAIKEAIVCLGRLDPHPGRLVGARAVPFIVPDATVDLDEQGEVVVSTRDGEAPPLRVSHQYLKLVRARNLDRQARDYLRKNLRSAQWLVGAIAQRRRTVRRVTEEVFAVQKEFLEQGPGALRPLPMTAVAVRVGVHVATVSRAVAGKYVQTPRGIFPLRMFFSGGTTTASGEDVAWDAIKVRMREIINRENKSRPLADDQIAQALSADGIAIARRTVAKYRNLLNIPPARQRKRY
jgi:RNA polymerase sigma-54 factor